MLNSITYNTIELKPFFMPYHPVLKKEDIQSKKFFLLKGNIFDNDYKPVEFDSIKDACHEKGEYIIEVHSGLQNRNNRRHIGEDYYLYDGAGNRSLIKEGDWQAELVKVETRVKYTKQGNIGENWHDAKFPVFRVVAPDGSNFLTNDRLVPSGSGTCMIIELIKTLRYIDHYHKYQTPSEIAFELSNQVILPQKEIESLNH